MNELKIKYPDDIVTDIDKLAYVLRLKDLLKKEYLEYYNDYTSGTMNQKDWENYVKDYNKKDETIKNEDSSHKKKQQENQSYHKILKNSFEDVKEKQI